MTSQIRLQSGFVKKTGPRTSVELRTSLPQRDLPSTFLPPFKIPEYNSTVTMPSLKHTALAVLAALPGLTFAADAITFCKTSPLPSDIDSQVAKGVCTIVTGYTEGGCWMLAGGLSKSGSWEVGFLIYRFSRSSRLGSN